MKIPISPPLIEAFLEEIVRDAERGAAFFRLLAGGAIDPAPDGKYRHWDILRHLEPPEGLDSEEWWAAIKLARRQLSRQTPLLAKDRTPFRFTATDAAQRMLHRIDQQSSGAIKGSDQVTDPTTRDTYLIKTLFEEAITSSQLEGAATTREVAKDMLQRGRAPRNRSEQMIHNNYQAMQFIRQLRDAPLTPGIIFEVHRLVTHQTLDDTGCAGRFRRADESIHIVDETGRVLHIPPDAAELPERLETLCAFANDRGEMPFLHPVVRSILLHFQLAYDHPFVDGNGRTARALFYWSMARHGYWLAEFISISRIIKEAPGKYVRAFLYTETDENDATYFILNQLRTTLRAIDALHEYLSRKTRQLRETERIISPSGAANTVLNPRQLALIAHATRKPGFTYTIDSHRRSHAISYQTARTDLLALLDLGLLAKASSPSESGRGRKSYAFVAPADLVDRLGRLSSTRR